MMRLHLFAMMVALLLSACDSRPPAEPANISSAASQQAAHSAAAQEQGVHNTPIAVSGEATTQPGAAHARAAPSGDPAGDQAVNDAIDSSLSDHLRYRPVIDALQAAVAANDAAKVATLVHYPIGVDIGGKPVVLKNEREFVARYEQFMTPDIRTAIVGTKYAELFVNYKGIMFGSGQAWINGICKDDRCQAFDVKVVTLQHGPAD